MERRWFAQRNGYRAADSLVKETITDNFRNGIINMFCKIQKDCHQGYGYYGIFSELDKTMHTEFLRLAIFNYKHDNAILLYLQDAGLEWYDLFSFLEWCYYTLSLICKQSRIQWEQFFLEEVNRLFMRENYVYRFTKSGYIIEVTFDAEITSIDKSLDNPIDSIREHIITALKHLSASQKTPDYRNSIKESISAVEACCRYITGESTLDKALAKLEGQGVVINGEMKKGFTRLYYYTNDATTGIRHALMDDENAPTSDEAIYMLVACSCFINYLTKKHWILSPKVCP